MALSEILGFQINETSWKRLSSLLDFPMELTDQGIFLTRHLQAYIYKYRKKNTWKNMFHLQMEKRDQSWTNPSSLASRGLLSVSAVVASVVATTSKWPTSASSSRNSFTSTWHPRYASSSPLSLPPSWTSSLATVLNVNTKIHILQKMQTRSEILLFFLDDELTTKLIKYNVFLQIPHSCAPISFKG